MPLTPVRITFDLLTPVVMPSSPFHIDALVAFFAAREAQFDEKSTDDAVLNLPLGRAGNPSVWTASQVLFKAKDTGQTLPIRRMTNIPRMAADRRAGLMETKINSINMGTGHFKAYDARFTVQSCSHAVAWALTTDQDRLTELLSEVNSLGPIRRNGWGRIKKVTVVVDEDAKVLWRMRNLPSNASDLALANHVLSTGTLNPPYYERKNATQVLEWPSQYTTSIPVVN